MNALIRTLEAALRDETLTRTELARRAGCTRQHLHGILTGKNVPSLPMAEALARAAGAKLKIERA